MTDDPLVPTGFRLSFTPQEPSSPANTIDVKDPAQRDSRLTTFTYDNADRLLSQFRPGGKSVT